MAPGVARYWILPRWVRNLLCAAALTALAATSAPTRAVEIIYPTADGTLVDGGVFGSRDGVVDSANWSFTPIGLGGPVTLATETAASAVEHRVVCEYDLRGVSFAVPVKATLTFSTRGASVSPFPDVVLHVYSYPADLIESPDDFSAGPAVLQGAVTVTAMQVPRTEGLDVTDLVSAALVDAGAVAFRFQIDPNSPHVNNQVFIDALDTEPSTKPVLIIQSAMVGDGDGDGDIDLDDFAMFGDCLGGPGAPTAPTMPGVGSADCAAAFDRDADSDVDLRDLSNLLGAFAR